MVKREAGRVNEVELARMAKREGETANEATVAVGSIQRVTLAKDKDGRSLFEVRLLLTHVSDVELFMKQTQAQVGFTFETRSRLLPLFEDVLP